MLSLHEYELVIQCHATMGAGRYLQTMVLEKVRNDTDLGVDCQCL